jgi:ABC-2 type transport system ATP-binding protein
MSVLEINGVSKHYGARKAVDNINFKLEPGEIVGFLGPNGAGKTTTMRMICGLIRPTSGNVRVLDQAVPGKSLRQLGAMIEEPSFYPYLSGQDNLSYAAGMHGGIPDQRITEVLELVNLNARAKDRVHKYSQGMRQRLGLARALLPNPKVLILDEPANGLDPEGVAELRDMIIRFGDTGLTVLVSSHILAEVEKFARRVLIIDKGKILADGPVGDLFHRINAADTAYRLETSEPARALEVLRREPWVIRAEALENDAAGNAVRIVMPLAAAYRLAPLLVQSNIPILEMRRDAPQQDLEDAYLEIVQKSQSATVQSATVGANRA